MKNEADAWFLGITLAENALDHIKPYGQVLYRFFQECEATLRAKLAVQR